VIRRRCLGERSISGVVWHLVTGFDHVYQSFKIISQNTHLRIEIESRRIDRPTSQLHPTIFVTCLVLPVTRHTNITWMG
jgi:hypothetical protein